MPKIFKNLIIIFYVIMLCTQIQAQRKPGNEWINYGQPYYKIKVVQNGIYRLSYSDLQNAGMNVSSLNPTHLQLFFRGVEVPLYLSSGNSTQFTATDYLEFYGQGNDGALDSVLYLKPSDDKNKSYSMYTDTAAYFLTIGSTSGALRYSVSNKTYSNNPAINFNAVSALNLHQNYLDGAPLFPAFNFTESDYNSGEGWMGRFIPCSNTKNPYGVAYTINLLAIPADTSTVEKPVLEMLIYGKSDVSGQLHDHHLVVLLKNRIIWDTVYNGFDIIHVKIQRYWSDIVTDSKGNSTVAYTIQSAGVAPAVGTATSDVQAVSYLKLHYPGAFRIDPNVPDLNFSYFNSSGNAQTDFDFFTTKPPSNNRFLVLYDLTNNMRTPMVNLSGLDARISIDNFNNNSNYYLYDTSQAKRVLSFTPVNFIKPDVSKNYNYIIITNKAFATGAKAFADYKSTQKIDSVNYFNPVIAYTDDLYDQFFYGVHHPAALQNYLAYMYLNAAKKPQYLLLLGKGINNAEVRSYFDYDYVPAIGLPPADVMYTAGIDIGFQGREKVIDPKMGIGRLQVMDNNEIYSYLNKLKEYDANLQKRQMNLKTAINVDGGDNGQITQFKNFMDAQAKVLGGPSSAIKVNSYYSVSNNAVNINLKAAIQANIESGTSMLSYLAHGAAEQFQVEIADTSTLKNAGHYPIMYLNGCSLGNSFLNPYANSSGRFYTLAANKGAIIWLAHTNEALDNVLMAQMPAFFLNIAKNNYGQSVGSTWRKTIVDLKSFHGANEYRALCYEWLLQGDPSVMFPSLPKPDYAVFDSSLYITPPGTIAASPSFNIAIPILNYGKTDPAKIKIEIKQTYPDQTFKVFDSMISPVNYMDTVIFTINRGNANIQGLNTFNIYVNPDSAVKEISYDNNHAIFRYYFVGNNVRALIPQDYDIVNVDTPALVSQSRNPYAYKTGIYYEMDTTDLFNSPLKQHSGIIKGSSLISWTPRLNYLDNAGNAIDSTVYYWRTKMNLPTDSGGEWENRSFVYIKAGNHGWSQSHWQQYKKIKPDLITIDTVHRVMRYLPKYANFQLSTTAFSTDNLGIKPDNDFFQVYCDANNTIALIEYDQYTLQPVNYNRITGKPFILKNCFSNYPPTLQVSFYQFDLTKAINRDSFVMAINAIPDGNYVLLVSRGTPYQSVFKFEPKVFQAFQQLGDTMMQNIRHDSVAFVIAGRKEKIKGELLGEDYRYNKSDIPQIGDTAMANVRLQGYAADTGTIISEKIGPATSWKTAFQVYRPLEDSSSDQARLRVFGTDARGNDTLIYDYIKPQSFDISAIKADKYPYLHLESILMDTVTRTPPQLRLWQVEYDGLPDGSLVGDSALAYPAGKYLQGDSIHIRVKFQNVSYLPMSKVLVRFNISDAKNNIADSSSAFYPALNPGDYFWIDKKFPTIKLKGDYFLNVFANPGFHQPEMTLDNNFIQASFRVDHIISNPIMDVTFDGQHIADGQIISPDPEIIVSTRDDNKLLPLNDTAGYKLSMLYPGSTQPDTIRFSNPGILFKGGDTTNDQSVITYHPGHLPDGLYRFDAQAWDRTGNIGGPVPYSIHFRIVNSPAISNVYFYPNPLTDISKFVFTITGLAIPEDMEITIYDVAGKRVKNLVLNNDIKPGINEISWDGTNDNGAKLSSGIYFYKVTVRFNGNSMNNYRVPLDDALLKGFGKIMILNE